MEQNNYDATLIKYEKTLKENYLPAFKNLITTEPSALLGKIQKIKLVGDEVVATAPIGLSGGFGFGAEGQATPSAGNVMYERFKTNAKDMYVNIALSVKAVRLTGTAGAMVNALNAEVKASYETAKWNIGRALFGNGTGVLANVTAVNGKEITVDDTKFVKEGLIIDLYAEGAETSTTTARILGVNRATKTVTLTREKLQVLVQSLTPLLQRFTALKRLPILSFHL